MLLKPSVPTQNSVQYLLDLKLKEIFKIYVTHESISGNSVLTDDGRVLRSDTKKQKIFSGYDWARAALKIHLKQFDDELRMLEKTLGIKISSAHDKL